MARMNGAAQGGDEARDWQSGMEADVREVKEKVDAVADKQAEHDKRLDSQDKVLGEQTRKLDTVIEQLGELPEQMVRARQRHQAMWAAGAYIARNAHSIAKWATPIVTLVMLAWAAAWAFTHGTAPVFGP